MTTLNNIESFLNIELTHRHIKDGKKNMDKNQYYYLPDICYVVKLTKDMYMIAEDCIKTRKLLRLYTWHVCSGYAMTGPGKSWHALFLNYDKGLVADHINNKRFDNRLDNLRVVTYTDNSKNRLTNSKNKSGKQGVY